MIFLFAS